MRFLVAGLGSMGKRRIRCLKALGHSDITGFDTRPDRRGEAQKAYEIKIVDKLERVNEYDAMFVSVPPDVHMEYAGIAFENGIHAFIEASVVSDGIAELWEKVRVSNLKFYASCTMRFHPSIKKIKSLVDSGALGVISNFSYHSGQYLPDWHPWESINDYYVSKKETGGCREIVPFELAWLNWVLGEIENIKGFNAKTIEMGADIDDTYAAAIKYKNGAIGTLTVDVVSRSLTRRLVLNGDKGQLIWDMNDRSIKHFNADEGAWTYYHEPEGTAANGYNPLIIEEMYINEVKAFLSAIENDTEVMNSLLQDLSNLNHLYTIERG